MTAVTASMLYDLVHSPHRPAMDLYGDAAERDEVNVFVQLLWERSSVFEKDSIPQNTRVLEQSKSRPVLDDHIVRESLAFCASHSGRVLNSEIGTVAGDPGYAGKPRQSTRRVTHRW